MTLRTGSILTLGDILEPDATDDDRRKTFATLKAELDDLIERGYHDLLNWSFVFWATTIIALFLRTR